MVSRILVVDGLNPCREFIADSLRCRGYEVDCAEDGESALATLREQLPDAVLLDMDVPGVDGLAVLRTIRSHREWRSLPVIMLTDQAEKKCDVKAAGHLIQGSLPKRSFSLDALLARVEACVAQPATAGHSAGHAEHRGPPDPKSK
jgi:DNA-binding response OmpR family regulator